MKIPLITRRRHDRDLTAIQLAQLTGRIELKRRTTVRERSDLVDRLERRAEAYDLDAAHVEAKVPTGVTPSVKPAPALTSTDRRAIADELRTVARDLTSTP